MRFLSKICHLHLNKPWLPQTTLCHMWLVGRISMLVTDWNRAKMFCVSHVECVWFEKQIDIQYMRAQSGKPLVITMSTNPCATHFANVLDVIIQWWHTSWAEWYGSGQYWWTFSMFGKHGSQSEIVMARQPGYPLAHHSEPLFYGAGTNMATGWYRNGS